MLVISNYKKYVLNLALFGMLTAAQSTYAQQPNISTGDAGYSIADVIKYAIGKPIFVRNFKTNETQYYDLILSNESCDTFNKIGLESNPSWLFLGNVMKTTLTAGATFRYLGTGRVRQEIVYPFFVVSPSTPATAASCRTVFAKSVPIDTDLELIMTASGSTDFDVKEFTRSLLSLIDTTISTITVFNPKFAAKIVSNKYKVDEKTYQEL
jgi:hypothetical protein